MTDDLAALVEVPLDGEGADRAFIGPRGHRFRVRVRRQDARAIRPTPNVPVDRVAPTQTTLCISLALLDDESRVVRSGDRFRIFDAHELLITAAMMAVPGFDLRRIVEAVIARQIEAAEATIDGLDQASTYLRAAWKLD